MGNYVISDILSDLIDYISYHFDHEEQIMRRHKYYDANIHTAEHANLINGLDQLICDFNRSPAFIGYSAIEYLRSWLVDHIMCADRRLGLYLRQNTNRR